MKIISDNAKPSELGTSLEQYQQRSSWFKSPVGRYLLGVEQRLVDQCLSRRFGYHLLQLSCSESVLHEQSPMGHKFSFCPHSDQQDSIHGAVARGEAMPLQSESVDLVLMHHALDYCDDQHQLLREVSRILIAGGSVVIVGFNPYSSWGLRNLLNWRKARRAPFNASMLSTHRLSDWLKLLDFQVEQIRYAAYALPVNSERWIRYTGWLAPLAARLNWPSGGSYVIVARKQVLPLTPVQQGFKRVSVQGLGIKVS